VGHSPGPAEPPQPPGEAVPEVLESIHHIGVSMMTEIRGSSNAKAKRELGWVPAHPTWRGVLGSAATR
jgi:hypothetical protein